MIVCRHAPVTTFMSGCSGAQINDIVVGGAVWKHVSWTVRTDTGKRESVCFSDCLSAYKYVCFFFLTIFQDCIQPFGYENEMLSWVRLRGSNAHGVSPQPQLAGSTKIGTSLVPILLLGEHGHHCLSSLSRAISQKVGGLGYRTGDPPIHGPNP